MHTIIYRRHPDQGTDVSQESRSGRRSLTHTDDATMTTDGLKNIGFPLITDELSVATRTDFFILHGFQIKRTTNPKKD